MKDNLNITVTRTSLWVKVWSGDEFVTEIRLMNDGGYKSTWLNKRKVKKAVKNLVDMWLDAQ